MAVHIANNQVKFWKLYQKYHP